MTEPVRPTISSTFAESATEWLTKGHLGLGLSDNELREAYEAMEPTYQSVAIPQNIIQPSKWGKSPIPPYSSPATSPGIVSGTAPSITDQISILQSGTALDIEVHLPQFGGRGDPRVVIEGVEITKALKSLELTAGVGEMTQVTVRFNARVNMLKTIHQKGMWT